MKINKITVQITLLLAVISLAISYIIYCFKWSDFWQNAMLGVFGSLLVAAIVSFVGYVHEKRKVLDRVYQNLISMYQNCCSLDAVLNNLAKNLETKMATQKILAELEIAIKIDALKPTQTILTYSNFKESGINHFFLGLLNFMNSFHMETMVRNIQITLTEFQLMLAENQLSQKYDDLTLQAKRDNVFCVLSVNKAMNGYIGNMLENQIIVMEKFYKPEIPWVESKKYIMAEVQTIQAELQKMNQR